MTEASDDNERPSPDLSAGIARSDPKEQVGAATDRVREELWEIVSLIAERLQIFQPPQSWAEVGGGRDVDCLVSGLDPLWPLRLPPEWRLCQVLQYRHARFQWWLERDREVLVVDTTEDPPIGLESGLSRLSLLHGQSWEATDPSKAIYLTRKRLFKTMRDEQSWEQIKALASSDEDMYLKGVKTTFGLTVGRLVAGSGLRGIAPEEALFSRARRVRLLRYPLRPVVFAGHLFREVSRVARRSLHPTGMAILVVGPDGTGKSSLASELIDDLGRLFRRQLHLHWRPGVLPRLGRFLGRQAADVTQPHAQDPHGRLLSIMVLLYYWIDFLIGSWILIQRTRVRTGLVVQERGWWDIRIDPRRYRLQVSRRLVSLLGRLLPRPDVVLVLDASVDVLLDRKVELPAEELQRQSRAWREVAPRISDPLFLDTSRSIDQLSEDIWNEVAGRLERRTFRRLGAGWSGVTGRSFRRWLIPRGPRRTAQTALSIYQPVTGRGRLGWRAARLLAAAGASRLLPRGEPPPQEVREIVRPHLPRNSTVAVARANEAGRYIAMMIDREGRCHKILKIATTEIGARALEREARALETIARSLVSPLSAPGVIVAENGFIVFEPVVWSVRSRPWFLPQDMAHGLGVFWRSGSALHRLRGSTHGDFAPWNVLATSTGWTILDWEEASEEGSPFFDILHYLVQAHALLGRPSEGDLIAGLEGREWVGAALEAYSEGAGVDLGSLRGNVIDYLKISQDRFDPRRRDGRSGIEARRRLLSALVRA